MRKLMMIAIAALALTSCQKEDDDVSAVSKKDNKIFGKFWQWTDGDEGTTELFANGDNKYVYPDGGCYYDIENVYNVDYIKVITWTNTKLSYSISDEDNTVYRADLTVEDGFLVYRVYENDELVESDYLKEVDSQACPNPILEDYDGKNSQPRRVRLF